MGTRSGPIWFPEFGVFGFLRQLVLDVAHGFVQVFLEFLILGFVPGASSQIRKGDARTPGTGKGGEGQSQVQRHVPHLPVELVLKLADQLVALTDDLRVAVCQSLDVFELLDLVIVFADLVGVLGCPVKT